MKNLGLVVGVLLLVGVPAWVFLLKSEPTQKALGAARVSSPPSDEAAQVTEVGSVPEQAEGLEPIGKRHEVETSSNEGVSAFPASSPCPEVIAQNKRLALEVEQLRAEVARLRNYGGRDPYQFFIQSSDAEAITDVADRTVIKGFLESFPVYLRPGEAIWLVENQNDTGGYGSIEENILRFLGPDRVLREVPPEWLAAASETYDEEEWQAIFGQPLPQK